MMEQFFSEMIDPAVQQRPKAEVIPIKPEKDAKTSTGDSEHAVVAIYGHEIHWTLIGK